MRMYQVYTKNTFHSSCVCYCNWYSSMAVSVAPCFFASQPASQPNTIAMFNARNYWKHVLVEQWAIEVDTDTFRMCEVIWGEVEIWNKEHEPRRTQTNRSRARKEREREREKKKVRADDLQPECHAKCICKNLKSLLSGFKLPSGQMNKHTRPNYHGENCANRNRHVNSVKCALVFRIFISPPRRYCRFNSICLLHFGLWAQ